MNKNLPKLCVALLMATTLHLTLYAQNAQPVLAKIPKAPAGVSIDGQLAEWNDTSFVDNKESGLKYIIATDNANLYVVAKVTNRMLLRKIMGAGITISINSEGKLKKSYSVTYPTVPSPDLDFVTKIQKQLTTVQTSGFKGVDNTITVPEEHGFKSAYVNSDEVMGYEVAIPLKSINIKPAINTLNINICVNAVDQSDAGPAGGGSSGGGSGGRGRGRDKSQDIKTVTRTDMFTATDFWLSYAL